MLKIITTLVGCAMVAFVVMGAILDTETNPPASPEFATYMHHTVEWPTECASFMDVDRRSYDTKTGLMSYPWTGTTEQLDACYGISPFTHEARMVFDTCPECGDLLSTTGCQGNIKEDGAISSLVMSDFYHDEQKYRGLPAYTWTGSMEELNSCPRVSLPGDHGIAVPVSGAGSYFAIEFDVN